MGLSFLFQPARRDAQPPVRKSRSARLLAAALAATLVAGSFVVVAPPAEAQGYRGHYGGQRYVHPGYGGGGGYGGYGHRGFGIGAGVIGGLALGALAAGAYNAPYYNSPNYAYQPAYDPYDDGCYTQRRRVWNGYRYVIRLVDVCN